ncbi:MAG: trypsin-like peptidase domain-containing protein [Chloroflexota bacterium]|nr:trypsin-like peptidase domain-containing protein [Chloroflexota bacterium]
METYDWTAAPPTETAAPPAPAPARATKPLGELPSDVARPYSAPVAFPIAGYQHIPTRQAKQPRSRLLIAGLLSLGLLTGGVGGGATAWTLAQTHPVPAVVSQAPAVSNVQPVDNSSASAISSLYTHVASAVVSIQVTTGSGRFAGGGQGSGIVLDSGHVLTNYHVVQGANTIRVVLQDGTSIPATLSGSAPQDDLAVVAANLPSDKVQAAVLGDSDKLAVGEEVIAIGNPFGLDHTVTAGIVSAVNRSWSSGNQPAHNMIQTDAPINPGNSGGALFNLQGEVIGINTAIESPVEGSVGIGFAIPINRAKTLVPQLSSGTTVQRAWLGISGVALDAAIASQVGATVSQGVLVAAVTAGSPAEKAGLHGADPTTSTTAGDIITAVDSVKVAQVQDISDYLATKHAGDSVTLTIVRAGKAQPVKVTLAPWPTTQPQTNSPTLPNGGNSTP